MQTDDDLEWKLVTEVASTALTASVVWDLREKLRLLRTERHPQAMRSGTESIVRYWLGYVWCLVVSLVQL